MRRGCGIVGHLSAWICMALLLAGCQGPPRPKPRLGGLPFPGPFTLHAQADPEKLGPHRYRLALLPFNSTQERGIIYTCRAGFLDIAHVRTTIDWARYFTHQYREALTQGQEHLVLRANSPSEYHVTLRYPASWDALEPPERQRIIDELALRLGLQTAWLADTWHEMITWFGYKATVILPEDRSAFSYDDTMSHVIGLRIADRALRDASRDYDEAVSYAMAEELSQLGVVSKDQAAQAIQLVKGHWWDGIHPLKRHLEVGMEENTITPWLVPGAPGCPEIEPEPFPLPTLTDVEGYDLSDILDVEIQMNVLESWKIRAVLPNQPRRVRPERDFPIIMEHIRQELYKVHGPEADQP